MELEMARFLNDREQMLNYLARKNIVPVRAVPWAKKGLFELRRNEKKRAGIGQHICSREMTASVIKVLCIVDENSCKEVREHIKHIRQSMDWKD